MDNNITEIEEEFLLVRQIAALEAKLAESPNSRQARRERIMCSLLANPDDSVTTMEYEDLIAYADGLLDASDAIDAKEKSHA